MVSFRFLSLSYTLLLLVAFNCISSTKSARKYNSLRDIQRLVPVFSYPWCRELEPLGFLRTGLLSIILVNRSYPRIILSQASSVVKTLPTFSDVICGTQCWQQPFNRNPIYEDNCIVHWVAALSWTYQLQTPNVRNWFVILIIIFPTTYCKPFNLTISGPQHIN